MNGRLLACFPVSSPVTPVTEAGRKHASNFYDSMGSPADAACGALQTMQLAMRPALAAIALTSGMYVASATDHRSGLCDRVHAENRKNDRVCSYSISAECGWFAETAGEGFASNDVDGK